MVGYTGFIKLEIYETGGIGYWWYDANNMMIGKVLEVRW